MYGSPLTSFPVVGSTLYSICSSTMTPINGVVLFGRVMTGHPAILSSIFTMAMPDSFSFVFPSAVSSSTSPLFFLPIS